MISLNVELLVIEDRNIKYKYRYIGCSSNLSN